MKKIENSWQGIFFLNYRKRYLLRFFNVHISMLLNRLTKHSFHLLILNKGTAAVNTNLIDALVISHIT